MDRWMGKTAVVTGASSGIGAAIAVDLVKAGCKVVGLARRIDRLEELREKMDFERGGQFYPLKCDITVEQEIKDAFAWITENLDGIHILVNNAGLLRNINVVDEDNSEAIRQTIDTVLFGTIICTREAFRIMKANGIDGHIVMMNSIAGHAVPYNGREGLNLNVYLPCKHAVTALTEILRQEFQYQDTNIKISSISPGIVRTEIFKGTDFELVVPKIPQLQPEDISQAVLYVLGTPPTVQIHELIIKPMGEMF